MRKFTVVLLMLLGGFSPPPPAIQGLTAYLQQNNFTPLDPARAGVIPGTMFQETAGGEITLLTPTQCAPSFNAPTPQPVALPDFMYSSTGSLQFDAKLDNLSKRYGISVDPVFSASNAKSVTITLKSPYEIDLTAVAAQQAVRSWSQDCKTQLTARNTVMTSRILGAKGISYKFHDENGHDAKFSASALTTITLSAELKNQLQTDGSMTINGDMDYGYRAFLALPSAGLLATGTVNLQELTPQQLNALKTGS